MPVDLHRYTAEAALNKQGTFEIIRVPLTIDTSGGAFGTGDCLTANLVEIPKAVMEKGGYSKLIGLSMFNKDNEDCGLSVVFFENNSTPGLGPVNEAPDMTDSEAEANGPLGLVPMMTQDQEQIGVWSIGTTGAYNDDSNKNPQLLLKAASDSTSVYFGVICRDTPTFGSTTDITMIFSIQY